MEWTNTLFIIFSIWAIVSWKANKIERRVKELTDRIDSQNFRMDTHCDTTQRRVDRLYSMFVDLLKEKR